MVRVGAVPADRLDDFFTAMGVPFSFDASPDELEEIRSFWQPEWLTAAYDGDDIVATFGSFPLHMRLPGGTTVPTGGTTVVTVMPTHRRQGILTALMRDHLDRERAAGSAMAALWASEAMIYGRYGYGIATDHWSLTLPRQHAVFTEPPDIAGTMRLVETAEALEVLPPLFEAGLRDRAGSFERTSHWWEHRILSDPPSRRSGHTAQRVVVHRRNGADVGYARWRTKGDPSGVELRVTEVTALDSAAEQALWQFLFGVDLVAEIKVSFRPADDPLRWWLVDPRKLKREESDALWIRPLDVAACLGTRDYAVDGAVTIAIADPWYDDIDGRWRLTVHGGKGAAVRTDGPPEVSMGVDVLGSLLMGGFGAEALAAAGRVHGEPAAIRRLDRMLDWPTAPFVQEIF